MKMQRTHFEELKALFEQPTELGVKIGDTARSVASRYKQQGFSAKRWRWDAFWLVPYHARQAWFDRNEIYSYLDDDHIDTALRSIFPESW